MPNSTEKHIFGFNLQEGEGTPEITTPLKVAQALHEFGWSISNSIDPENERDNADVTLINRFAPILSTDCLNDGSETALSSFTKKVGINSITLPDNADSDSFFTEVANQLRLITSENNIGIKDAKEEASEEVQQVLKDYLPSYIVEGWGAVNIYIALQQVGISQSEFLTPKLQEKVMTQLQEDGGYKPDISRLQSTFGDNYTHHLGNELLADPKIAKTQLECLLVSQDLPNNVDGVLRWVENYIKQYGNEDKDLINHIIEFYSSGTKYHIASWVKQYIGGSGLAQIARSDAYFPNWNEKIEDWKGYHEMIDGKRNGYMIDEEGNLVDSETGQICVQAPFQTFKKSTKDPFGHRYHQVEILTPENIAAALEQERAVNAGLRKRLDESDQALSRYKKIVQSA